ncbi:Dopamine D2-like receptor, partial [Stegodyphus mimosarum]
MKLTTHSVPLNGTNDSGYDGGSQQETQFCGESKIESAVIQEIIEPRKSNTETQSAPKRNGILVKTSKTKHSLGEVVVERKKKSRFNLGKRHKSSSKKREKASAKRERKATKTLAIV